MEIPPGIAIYAFIKRELKNQIESGELPEGARVPSEFELARTYNVSRNPTRQALRDLEIEGYLVRSPGRGSFVAARSQWQKIFRRNGSRAIAIACPSLEVHYNRTVIQGFIQYAAEQGFHTMVYFLHFTGEEEVEFLSDLRNGGIEGMAFWLQHITDRTIDLMRKFQRASFPFVLLDRYVRGMDTDCVITDNEKIAYELTHALIERGHHDIGFVTPEFDNTSTEDRFSGYRKALKDAGIAFNESLVGVLYTPEESNSTVVSRIMANRSRPTAFFCNNDGLAAGLMDELANLGFQVPGDIEIATVDDNELAAALEIPLITASQHAEEIGRRSAETLLARINNPTLPPQRILLPAILNPLPKPALAQ